MKTILVPVDFSDCSHDVVARAVGVAEPIGAELLLLHVIEPPSGTRLQDPIDDAEGTRLSVGDYLERDAERAFEMYAKALPEDLRVTRRVRTGRAADEIVAEARERSPEMIVMGTHGRSGLARLAFGSVAEHVLRTSECPVLTVRSHHHEGCEAKSCNWCDSGIRDAVRLVRREADG